MGKWFTVEATLDNGDIHVWHICTTDSNKAASKVAMYLNDNYSGFDIRAIKVREEI